MALPRYEQHPSAKRAYPIDVVGLGANTISAASSTISGGATVHSSTASGARVTVLVSGTTHDVLHQVETSITLSNGEIIIHEWEIQGKNN